MNDTACSILRVEVGNIPDEGIALQGDVSFSALSIDDDYRIRCSAPLEFSLHISQVHEGILVRGELTAVLECICDRCLDVFSLPMREPDVCHFFEGLDEPIIDLTEGIRQDILLAFPTRLLCDENCLGLCPCCGQNKNKKTCSCDETDGDASSPWSELDGLQLNSKS